MDFLMRMATPPEPLLEGLSERYIEKPGMENFEPARKWVSVITAISIEYSASRWARYSFFLIMPLAFQLSRLIFW